ncbi:hypothetical protein B5P46_24830 [Rhizobium leguminosarum]|uniref:Uncharacterized protein n=1 Tax=Rhizobium leguminosarum TaxID=384 RepID=A0A4V1P076_RHILE|nr:hypothetical protein [Rhizobium leguminosarum]RXT19550.1 hypothetical protein B5P46_24830 [Rhizobium leguminosarum]
MRLYEDGEFVEREDDRKSVRDIYREKFFASLSVDRSDDPFSVEAGSKSSLPDVLELAQKAIALHGGDASALRMSVDTLSNLALTSGASSLGNILDYQDTTVTSFAASHFLYSWRP